MKYNRIFFHPESFVFGVLENALEKVLEIFDRSIYNTKKLTIIYNKNIISRDCLWQYKYA